MARIRAIFDQRGDVLELAVSVGMAGVRRCGRRRTVTRIRPDAAASTIEDWIPSARTLIDPEGEFQAADV